MNLRDLRRVKKITQTELSTEINVHLKTIQAWESGKTQIPDKRLPKLAEIFGIEMDEILKLKYDFSEKNILKVAEEAPIYKKIINRYSELNVEQLKAMLSTQNNILSKITTAITCLENNGNDLTSVKELLEYETLKIEVLENIKNIEANL